MLLSSFYFYFAVNSSFYCPHLFMSIRGNIESNDTNNALYKQQREIDRSQ